MDAVSLIKDVIFHLRPSALISLENTPSLFDCRSRISNISAKMKKRTTICSLSYLFLISFCLTPLSSEAQKPKKGGFLGFGKKEEAVSGGLFPDKQQELGKEGKKMFKDGGSATTKPPVTTQAEIPVAEKTSKNKKKGGFFSFGKKSESQPNIPGIVPIPENAGPITLSNPPAPSTTHAAIFLNDPALATPSAPKAKGKRKFSFFPKKNKDQLDENDLKKIADAGVYQTVEGTPPTPGASTALKGADPQNNKVGGNGIDDLITQAPTDSPQEPQADQTKKKKRKLGFPKLAMPSLPKVKKPGKKTDYTSVETVMKDGAFVEKTETETTFSNAPLNENGERRPPTVVNGVKTYSNWNDVEGRSTSAADKILRQLR